jgi:hypothetical protein
MFFYKSDYHLFSEEIRTELREYASFNASYQKNGNEENGYDGNDITMFQTTKIKVIDNLVKNCQLFTQTVLIKQLPGQTVIRHVDGIQWSRTTVISIPLTMGKHTDTYFWESFDSVQPAAILTYNDTLPVVLNTTSCHSLENNTELDRLTLQFEFRQPIEEVVGYLKAKTLFKLT